MFNMEEAAGVQVFHNHQVWVLVLVLTVVNMSQDADVSDVSRVPLQSLDPVQVGGSHPAPDR